jgi:hypothetical protein
MDTVDNLTSLEPHYEQHPSLQAAFIIHRHKLVTTPQEILFNLKLQNSQATLQNLKRTI